MFDETKLNMKPKDIVQSRTLYEAIKGNISHQNEDGNNELHALVAHEIEHGGSPVELDVAEYFILRSKAESQQSQTNPLSARNNEGRTPAMVAFYYGHTEVSKKMIASGADVNVKDNSGTTLLHMAVAANDHRVVEQLIHRGADLNARDNEGYSPLETGLYARSKRCMDLLIEHGADVSAVQIKEKKEFFLAAEVGIVSVFEKMAKNIGDINSKSIDGDTALHIACKSNNFEVAKYLLSKGAETEVLNRRGVLPYQIAENETADMVRIDTLQKQLQSAIDAKQYRVKGESVERINCSGRSR